MKKIVYQGIEGSFSHATSLAYGKQLIGVDSFKELFQQLKEGKAEIGLIPLENSLAGSIHENYDLLYAHDFFIQGEAYTKVEHCLLGLGAREEIKKVYSHPKALEQCQKFFAAHPWIEPIVHFDTAGAAREISLWKDPSCAAIASSLAAEIYGLRILEKNLEDHVENFTRFALISIERPAAAKKCSIAFIIKHEAGALLRVLTILADHGANLTKIESRPLKGKPFEYIFYVDLLLKEMDLNILEKIKGETVSFKLLGFYL